MQDVSLAKKLVVALSGYSKGPKVVEVLDKGAR